MTFIRVFLLFFFITVDILGGGVIKYIQMISF